MSEEKKVLDLRGLQNIAPEKAARSIFEQALSLGFEDRCPGLTHAVWETYAGFFPMFSRICDWAKANGVEILEDEDET